jgi:hypothetical protein
VLSTVSLGVVMMVVVFSLVVVVVVSVVVVLLMIEWIPLLSLLSLSLSLSLSLLVLSVQNDLLIEQHKANSSLIILQRGRVR